MGQVYYFPGHPLNTISSGALNVCVVLKIVVSEPLENFDFVDPHGHSWKLPYQTQNNLDYLQIDIFLIQPSKRQEYCCTNCLFNIKT